MNVSRVRKLPLKPHEFFRCHDKTIDLFGLIRHTLVTWSEMGKQTLSSIERHIEYHISIPQIARMVHYCKVFDCNNNSTDERLSFHKFPDDPKLRKVCITFVLKNFKS